MSTTRPIDEKIVKISLDSTLFKRGVTEVLDASKKLGSSLANSIQGLDISDSVSGFKDLSDSILYNENSLSVLGMVAANVLSDISSKVMGLAQQFMSEWAIQPITDGFNEYELKMNSVQTIMNGTGESLERVNGKLNELNTYSDQTIYSFQDMTSNIGKFTNAGVDLDTAVASIKGVANAAAHAGVGAGEASRAMYNLGQALGSGVVRLQDWMSIENANMATSTFKQTLIDSAVEVGALTVAEDGLAYTTEGAVVTTDNFRESLAEKWLVTDALTNALVKYTDTTTEVGAAATKAATQVKTFSQLIDTTKEGLASGWAQSFELIFGDLETATELWTGLGTAIGDSISKSADSRNAVLQNLRDWGAFDMLFEALGNSFKGVYQWIKVITDAWSKIFPPATSNELFNIIKRFKDFTYTLDATRDQLDSFSRLFEGLFSVLKTVGTILGNIGIAFLNLIPTGLIGGVFGVAEGMGGVLDIVNALLQPLVWLSEGFGKLTGIIGDVINRGLIVLVDTFHEVMQAFTVVTDFLTGGWDSVSLVVEKVISAFNWLKDGFKSFIDFVMGGKESLKIVTDGIKSNIDSMGESIKNFFEFITGGKESFNIVVTKLSEGVDKTTTAIKSLLDGNAGGLLAAGGVFAGLVWLGKKLFTTKDGIINPVKKIKESITDFVIPDIVPQGIGRVTEAVEQMQTAISPSKILMIGASIGILVISINKLSTIPVAEISKSLIAIAKMLGIMSAALFVLSFIKLGDTSVFKLVTLMIGVAAAMTILADVLTVLSALNIDQIATSLIAFAGTMGVFILGLKLLDMATSGGASIKLSIQVVAVAKACEILGNAVIKFGEMNVEQIMVGVGALLAVMGGIILVSKLAGTVKASTVIGIAISMTILGNVVQKLGALDIDSLAKGLIGIAGAMTVMALGGLALKYGTENGKVFIAMATGLIMLMKPINDFAGMSWESLGKGLLGFAVVLGGVAAAAFLLKDNTSSGSEFIKIGFGINGLIRPIKQLAKLPFPSLLAGLFGLAGALGIMIAAVKIMEGSTGGASMSATLILFGIGLSTLVVPIAALGSLPFEVIAKGIATIGIAVGVLVLAAPAIGAAAIPMLGFSGALLAFSAALLLASVAFPAAMAAITIMSILLPPALIAIGLSFLALLKVIEWVVPATIKSIGKLTESILIALQDLINRVVPALVDTTIVMTTHLLDGLSKMVIALLGAIEKHIGPLITAVVSAVNTIITGLINNIPSFVQTLIDGFITLINAFAQGIRDNAEPLFDAVKNVIASVLELVVTAIEFLVTTFLGWIPGVNDAAGKMADSARVGIQEWFGVEDVSAIGDEGAQGFTDSIMYKKDAAKSAGESLALSAEEGIDKFDPSSSAADGMTAFNKAISDNYALAGAKGKVVAKRAEKGTTEVDFSFSGDAAASGFIKGLNSDTALNSAWTAGSKLGQQADGGARSVLEINSPSRAFARIGGYAVEGFVNAISAGEDSVAKQSRSLGLRAVDSVQNACKRIIDYLDLDFDFSPAITPVLDMSGIGGIELGANVRPNANMDYYNSDHIRDVNVDGITINIETRDTQQASETLNEFKSKVVTVLKEELRKVKKV